MKILVTGAAGLLGRHLIPHLADGNELILTDIAGYDRLKEILTLGIDQRDHLERILYPGIDQRIILEPLDITEKPETYRVIDFYQPDIVVNLAAYTDVTRAQKKQSDCFLVNNEAAGDVANVIFGYNTAFSTAIMLVFISCDHVFDGEKEGGMYTENDQPNPISCCGSSKSEAELAVLKELPGNSLIIRTSHRDKPFEHLAAAVDMWTSAGYVGDTASEIAKAILHCQKVILMTPNNIIHIADGERRTMHELALYLNQDIDQEVDQTTISEIEAITGLQLPKDVSLDSSLWRQIKEQLGI